VGDNLETPEVTSYDLKVLVYRPDVAGNDIISSYIVCVLFRRYSCTGRDAVCTVGRHNGGARRCFAILSLVSLLSRRDWSISGRGGNPRAV